MMELLNQLDGFESTKNIKVSSSPYERSSVARERVWAWPRQLGSDFGRGLDWARAILTLAKRGSLA
jgi:hypothetical protein